MNDFSKIVVSGRLLFTLVLITLLCGCIGSTERLAPQFPNYRQSMGTMLVMAPEIRIFEQLPDGGQLFLDAQSREAQTRAQASIVRQLRERRFSALSVDTDAMQQPEYHEIAALFRSVNRSIQLHTYGPQIFPAKVEAFDYHLGTVADLLTTSGADALVMATGFQTGSQTPAYNWFSLAVVEPHGRIIWFSTQGNPQRFDLQSADGMADLVATTMANFWEHGS
jgi:hypothetical protein